ncbi:MULTISPECIES: hypothetical protein [Glutamicibacter]|uniref:hypothetical protein n=1 Tax=Glutamicibacter sp. TaxID=1931995 RepID=UPI00187D6D5B|nr:hypothetical protein [Glutamicibacter arilaitensis]
MGDSPDARVIHWGHSQLGCEPLDVGCRVALIFVDDTNRYLPENWAAGGILTMIADTMIPEAYAAEHDYTGLLVTTGFLAAFSLHVTGG